MGRERNDSNAQWDPANIAATYFALLNLTLLGDGLGRVNKQACLAWLKNLQLPDGTFGEALGMNGEAEEGQDMRFCYCAAVISWILGEDRGTEGQLDVDGLLRFFEASQTYEGGFANGPFHEAHGTPIVASAAG